MSLARLGLLLLAAACGAVVTPSAGDDQSGSFAESTAAIANPERGFYDVLDLTTDDPLPIGQEGMTLAYAGVRLDAFRAAPLSDELLASLSEGLGRVRAAGIKVILRFAYNDGFNEAGLGDDAAEEQVLAHIEQLAPILAANTDVIAAMQAGFIGAWGEWHSSMNGLATDAPRRRILTALLAAVPTSRAIQVRTPMYKRAIFADVLSEANAFSAAGVARVGHHDDCFLASADDLGTYEEPVEDWKQLVANEGRFVPVGGETCAPNPPRSECADALAEMARLHWSFVNSRYHPEVLAGWAAGGCKDELELRLGYRFVLRNARFSAAVPPGGKLALVVRLANQGFASPYNVRPVYIVLDDGVKLRAARLAAVDPRRWWPGEEVAFTTTLRVPVDMNSGPVRLGLWLPDADPSLAGRSEYAIRFANEGTWDATAGYNVLTDRLTIDPAADGDADPQAANLAELP